MSKQKTIPELKAEIAANERQLAQLRHKQQQLENRIAYYEKGDRRKRAHRLITRGAAVESVAPLAKVLSETEFYAFAEKAFALPEVRGLLMEAVNEHNKTEFGGAEQIPTQHEGPTVRAMEAKGIHTDKGDLNRWIRKTNAMLREAKQKIVALIDWLKEVKAELSKPQPPTLAELLSAYYDNRNKGAYSSKARITNLKKLSEAVSYLEIRHLYTADDLDVALHTMQGKIDTMKKSASGKQARIKELDELLRMADYYKAGKPVADKLKTIRFEKSRQKYKAEHDEELRLFYMAERKLRGQVVDGKLPAAAWRAEKARLETEYRNLQTELTPLYADTKRLWAIHYSIYEVQHEQERQNASARQKKQEIEH